MPYTRQYSRMTTTEAESEYRTKRRRTYSGSRTKARRKAEWFSESKPQAKLPVFHTDIRIFRAWTAKIKRRCKSKETP